MKKLAILAGGGDGPGLNAVIRAAVKTAVQVHGCQILSARVVDLPLEQALAVPKRVDLGGDAVLTAHNLGVSFGD